MTSFFSYILKSLCLIVFNISVLATLLRLLVLFLVIFFVLPVFAVSLASMIVRTELFLLCAIVLEFLSFRIYQAVSQETNYTGAKKGKKGFIHGGLISALSSKRLHLFVHTNNVNIGALMPEGIYREVALEGSGQDKFRVFDHQEKPVVSMEMEFCRQALKSFVIYPELALALKAIKKSQFESLTFVLSVEDLFASLFDKKLLVQIHGFAFDLREFLSRKLDINLVVDNTHAVKGFETFLRFYPNHLDLFNIEIPISRSSARDIFTIFDEKFAHFNASLDSSIRSINFAEEKDAQEVFIFSQQIDYLKIPLKEIVASLAFIPKFSLSFFNQIFCNVFLLSSFQGQVLEQEVLPGELKSCLISKEK